MATISVGALQQFHDRLAAPTAVRRTTDGFACASLDSRDRASLQNKVSPFITVVKIVDSRGNFTMKAKLRPFGSGACAAAYSSTAESLVTSMEPMTLYDVLGISNMVTDDEIKAAFRRIAKEVHPDQAPPDKKVEYQRKFMEAQKAYSILKDPRTRAMYNFEMSHTLCRTQSTAEPRAEFRVEDWRGPKWRGYNWETDQCWTS